MKPFAPTKGRPCNRRRVLTQIRTSAPIGRAELAKSLGLSVQATSNITDELCSNGFIHESGRREGRRGLPVVLYDLRADAAFSLGIEVRPGILYATLIDQTGKIRDQKRQDLAGSDPAHVVTAIRSHIAALETNFPIQGALIGVGIGLPGPLGTPQFPLTDTELKDWTQPNLQAELAEDLALPVVLENDATAAASAEHQTGVAQGIDDFAYLYFGKGLGLGAVANGQTICGAFGNFGEIGKLHLHGIDGLVEDSLSRLSAEHHLTQMSRPAHTLDEIDKQFRAGALDDWITQAAHTLQATVTMIETLFDPATIVLGGAMPSALLSQLIQKCALPATSLSVRPDRVWPRLQIGTCGPFTVANGGASLLLDRHFKATI